MPKKDSVPAEVVAVKKEEIKKTKTEEPKTVDLKQPTDKKIEEKEEAVPVVQSSAKIKIRIRSMRDCSVKIVDSQNKSFDVIDKIVAGNDYSEFFPPGTYTLTAVDLNNPSTISQGRITVTSNMYGKSNSFPISWKD